MHKESVATTCDRMLLSLEREGNLAYPAERMDLQNIEANEINQSQKNKERMIPLL